MTGEQGGRRRHETRLSTIDATESSLAQVDLRVHGSAADRLSFPLPVEANTWLGSDGREILWLGPYEWLILASPDPREPGRLISELERALDGIHHSVVDVSAARAVIELSADDRLELLSTGCALDLHSRSWRHGMCAQTLLARVPVILQERERATRVFVRPSFTDYLVDWLLDASGV